MSLSCPLCGFTVLQDFTQDGPGLKTWEDGRLQTVIFQQAVLADHFCQLRSCTNFTRSIHSFPTAQIINLSRCCHVAQQACAPPPVVPQDFSLNFHFCHSFACSSQLQCLDTGQTQRQHTRFTISSLSIVPSDASTSEVHVTVPMFECGFALQFQVWTMPLMQSCLLQGSASLHT